MFRAAMDAGGMDLRNVVPNPKAPPRDPAFNKWLYDYDTIEQVRRHLNGLQSDRLRMESL